MPRSLAFSVSLALALQLGLPLPARADYDQRDAIRDCEHRVNRHEGSSEFKNLVAEARGRHDYAVSGRTRRAGSDDWSPFQCTVRHGEVTSWNIGRGHHDDEDDDGGDAAKAVAIGAGVLGVALIAAAAASAAGDDAPRYDKRRDDWHSYDPFADPQALRSECQQELVRHLRHDHGPVSDVRLADAHLQGRQLADHGEVSWASGEFSKITYTCQYDRTGRVVDGDYRYGSR